MYCKAAIYELWSNQISLHEILSWFMVEVEEPRSWWITMPRQWPGIHKRAKREPEGGLVRNILQALCFSSSLDSCPDFSQRWTVTQKRKPNKQFPPQVDFCHVLPQQQKAEQSTGPEVCLLGDSVSWNLIIYINNCSCLSSTHPGWPGRPESHVYP